ncbi:MAG: Lrp/AsnC ligand binding domain-containing protein [Anaerolineae bacterium]
MRAYVLINVERDPTAVAQDLSQIEGVKEADALFGPTDVIALVEAPDMEGLENLLLQIYGVGGVVSTDTRIAFGGK